MNLRLELMEDARTPTTLFTSGTGVAPKAFLTRFEVYVTTKEIPESAVRLLESVANVRVYEKDGPPTRETLLEEVRGIDGLFCLVTERIDEQLMESAGRLRVVANMAVGFDNIDLEEATKRRILVSNTPGVLTDTVADFTFALLLTVARRVVEADRYVRAGRWVFPWSPMMMVGTDVHGKTLGIYGLGRIGGAVARRAKGFGMKLVYCDSVRNRELEKEYGIEYMPLDQVLRECDFLSIHVPLLQETRHSIGEKQLSLMKKSAILVNTARGPIVDQPALVKALKEGTIAGAGLDVFEGEPVDRDSPLLKMDNVVIVPHIASGSVETRTAMAMMAARNIVAGLKGEAPPQLLNKEALAQADPQ